METATKMAMETETATKNGNGNGNGNGNNDGNGGNTDGNGGNGGNGGNTDGNGGNGGNNPGNNNPGNPDAPVLRATANGQTEISLSWDAPADNGAAITRYELQVSDNGTSGWSGLGGEISPSATSHPHTGLSAGTTKYYQIRAYNSEGSGAWSNVANATTQAGRPGAPTLRATANSQTQIDLSWDAPANNGMPITRYELQESDDGISWRNLDTTLGTSPRTYNHTNLSPGTKKYYRILARNSEGPGAWSNVDHATTQADVPGQAGATRGGERPDENRPLLG